LSEGKNREIRRLFLSVGNEVTRLKRIAFGALKLGDLPAGETRELTREEVEKAFPNVPNMTR
jgi:16S rRNA U516 pseudouridylate synthase RsuA-like enzyme